MKAKIIAEFIGTFAIVFFGCGGVMIQERFPGSLNGDSISLIFGLVVATMIYALGHISGAHFNPAVTLGFAVGRHFPPRDVPYYWSGQFAGALLAMAFLDGTLPLGASYGATIPHIPLFAAVCWEVMLTFVLMFVIISVATDTRAEGTMAGAAIGATVALCAMVGGPISGASMNPARSFAPALFQQNWEHHWIYLIGPCVGAVAAAMIYQTLKCDPDSKKNNSAKGCC